MAKRKAILLITTLAIIAVGCFVVQQVLGVGVQNPINMNYGSITNLGTSGGDYEAVNGSYLRSSLGPIYTQLSSVLTSGQDYGRYNVASTLYEGTTYLSNRYLGKYGKAADADKLDGSDSSVFQKRVSGSCWAGDTIRVVDSYGSVTCEDDDVGISTGMDWGRRNVSLKLYEGTTQLSLKYLQKNARADDADKLDGHDSSYFLTTTGKAADANNLDYHDSSYFQRRVSGSCSSGSAMQIIYEDGSVYCRSITALWRENPLASNDIYYPDGNVAIGKSQANYPLDIKGDLAVSGTKNFVIDHPTKESTKLIHSTLEGPEAAVFYRGEAQLTDGQAIIELPDYFEALTRKAGRTVLLTLKFESDEEPISNLTVSLVEEGKFKVWATDAHNPNQKFFWEVKAIRADVPPLIEVQLPPGS